MADDPKLTFVLAKGADGKLAMWACRGAGKGCRRNQHRTTKAACEDCLPTRDDETIGDVMDRLARGDA